MLIYGVPLQLIHRNESETLALFERTKPDYVIHLAGKFNNLTSLISSHGWGAI